MDFYLYKYYFLLPYRLFLSFSENKYINAFLSLFVKSLWFTEWRVVKMPVNVLYADTQINPILIPNYINMYEIKF